MNIGNKHCSSAFFTRSCMRIRRNFRNWAPQLVPEIQKNFSRAHLPNTFFSYPYWPPNQFPTRKHAKMKNFFLQNAIFHFLLFFILFELDSVSSEFRTQLRNTLGYCLATSVLCWQILKLQVRSAKKFIYNT